MHNRNLPSLSVLIAVCLAAALLLSGCKPVTALPATAAATETAASATTAEAAATAPAGPYMPIPADACQTLKTDAETALKVTFVQSEAPFFDYVSQEGGAGCLLTAQGTGADFESPVAVVNALQAAFVGWTVDQQYAAGGPTGDAAGMTRDQALMLISAQWTPAPDANCPNDQPIAACKLTPEQQLYTVTVNTAMK